MKAQKETEASQAPLVTLELLTEGLVTLYEVSLMLGDKRGAVEAVHKIIEINGMPEDDPAMQKVIADTLAGR